MIHPLVSLLTLEEKARLVSGASFWKTRSVERLGIEAATLTDGPHGVRMQPEAADHLGINASLPSTAFPTASTLGSSWDPNLIEEVGRALGVEGRRFGVDVLLGPGVNIKRSPLCGRNFEYFSEDPVLSGVLGVAWTRGVQSQGVGVSVKHFAANNQETDRMRVSAEVDERTLREIYLPAFEAVVKEARPATVMCSYNRINGTYAAQNRWLLTEVLRDDWGFDGYVVSDWGAVVDPVAAVRAGLDLEMPSSGDRSPVLLADAVRQGTLDESLLDRAVSRIVSTHDRIRASRAEAGSVDFDAHHQLARRAAAEGAVLLANDGQLLPLDAGSGGRIAVIGEFARTPRYQGSGSSHINPTRLDDALSAFRGATDREIVFEPGFTFDGADSALQTAAVEAARGADVVIAFLGLPPEEESEGFDRTTMELPDAQLHLLDALLEVNTRIVAVLSNGGVVSLSQIAGRVPAIVEMWLGGQASGSAAADLLFGQAAPGGRLAETIPFKLSDTPSHTNWPGHDGRVLYGERIYIGYRWYDATEREVLFPFGFGLTYTDFEYSNLRVTVPDAPVAAVTIQVTVTNIGPRSGSEVVQLYISDPASEVDRPLRELKAFEKVHLGPGESRRVSFELDERAFAYWGRGGWTVNPGEFVIEIGASSRDIRQRTLTTINVPAPAPTLQQDSTFREWIAHPVGNHVVQTLLDSLGDAAAPLMNPDTIKLIESMPLPNLLSMAGGADGRLVVAQLLEQVQASSNELLQQPIR